ncbi:serine protease [Pontibacillus halophilus JSM 076056 = DSM 19796]|uniref:Serine protease n=1 Tax=Pontibacillus halophilus JSM 076056 = DSM 19796 TaxID=1385510 RepID=A0A0A5ICY1_9BACI|nr:trypsin-like peptidase domain-containing protein [Pontibacillus halophilus]KGX93702.1 serine protease [Pontibacillus halophilus JSM 076056 = DSM 19796]
MGYYDDHAPERNRRRKPRWIGPTILGVILGIFIVFLALPSLIRGNLMPYDVTIGDEEDAQVERESGTTSGDGQTVNVDVTTQITEVVSDVQNTVVGVVNISQRQSGFFEQSSGTQQQTGSGVIYKLDGDTAYVVTNNHVIEGADEIELSLMDGTRVEAELLGGDQFTDLAVLSANAANIEKAIEIGDSSQVKVGEPAIAIGNPLGLQFAGSVTKGIISGKQRAIPQDFNGDGLADWQAEVMQTDAAINPGNSGGALVNIEGQLIGINSMKIAQSSVEGIGLAIPINQAMPIIEDIEQDGEVTRPYMGVSAYSLSEVPSTYWDTELNLPAEVETGVIVESVQPTTPADQAGLERYDVIVEMDGEQINDIIDLRKHLYNQKAVGDEMTVSFYRNGELQETTMTLSTQ